LNPYKIRVYSINNIERFVTGLIWVVIKAPVKQGSRY